MQEKKTVKAIFPLRFEELMRAHGKTQADVADYLGISQASVSQWKRGSIPGGDLLPGIAEFFHVTVDYLLGLEQQSAKQIANPTALDDAPANMVDYWRNRAVKAEKDLRKIQKIVDQYDEFGPKDG